MFEKVFESTSDVILIVSQDQKIVDVSGSVIEMFDYEPEELIGSELTVLLPQRFHSSHYDMFKGFTNSPMPRRMGGGRELFAVRKGGEEFDVDVGLSFFEKDGDTFYTAIIRDITDLKKTQRDLEQRNRELDDFAHLVSHDLKAPTRAVLQLINVIAEDHISELSENVKEYLRTIRDRTQLMARLIDDILKYSIAEGAEAEVSEFTLSDIDSELRSAIPVPEGFKLEFPTGDYKFRSSKVLLLQVLTNLVENAFKYHDKKSGSVSVEVSKKEKGYLFAVTDDGPGIHKDYHEHIFRMFGKAHGSDRPDSTGIGLAIVKKIIERNGGTIRLRSKRGEGSSFEFMWMDSVEQ